MATMQQAWEYLEQGNPTAAEREARTILSERNHYNAWIVLEIVRRLLGGEKSGLESPSEAIRGATECDPHRLSVWSLRDMAEDCVEAYRTERKRSLEDIRRMAEEIVADPEGEWDPDVAANELRVCWMTDSGARRAINEVISDKRFDSSNRAALAYDVIEAPWSGDEPESLSLLIGMSRRESVEARWVATILLMWPAYDNPDARDALLARIDDEDSGVRQVAKCGIRDKLFLSTNPPRLGFLVTELTPKLLEGRYGWKGRTDDGRAVWAHFNGEDLTLGVSRLGGTQKEAETEDPIWVREIRNGMTEEPLGSTELKEILIREGLADSGLILRGGEV